MKKRKLLAYVFITIGGIGVLLELIKPMIMATSCFGNQHSILTYLLFIVLIVVGIKIRK